MGARLPPYALLVCYLLWVHIYVVLLVKHLGCRVNDMVGVIHHDPHYREYRVHLRLGKSIGVLRAGHKFLH